MAIIKMYTIPSNYVSKQTLKTQMNYVKCYAFNNLSIATLYMCMKNGYSLYTHTEYFNDIIIIIIIVTLLAILKMCFICNLAGVYSSKKLEIIKF